MSISIREVIDKKGLYQFIKFPFRLYKNDPNWVPPLIRDELKVFSKKNTSLKNSQFKLWLAYKDNHIVGRIAGIINREEATKEKIARFGWIDFEDKMEVSMALMKAVQSWAKEKQLEGVHGPLGFSDMDPEGMLVEGFDSPATIATIYNYHYYPIHLESMGFVKSVDWIEGKGSVPKQPSKQLLRIAQLVESRFKIRSLKFTSRKQAISRGKEMFDVLNKSYKNLYGFHPLNPEEVKYYIKKYFGFVKLDLISIVVNKEDDVIGFAISMPSLTTGFQKANGRLFPFGFYHILQALKKSQTADLYLIGVLPKYQRMGVTSIIFRDLINAFNRRGITQAITNQMLEKNQNVLTQFNEYQEDTEMYKRRRCYIKHF